MVELFEWEEQEANINLSGSGMEPIASIEELERTDGDPKELLADLYGVSKDNIIFTHGAQEAMFLVLAAFKQDVIDIPIPTYPPIIDQARMLGMKVNFIESPLESKNKLLSLVNPNNPTGEYISIRDIIGNKLVVVDEIFKPFVNKKFEYVSGTILIMSTSKFFSILDHKIGWIIADKENIRRIQVVRDLISPPPIGGKWIINYIIPNIDYFYKRNLSIIKMNYSQLDKMNKYFHIIYNSFMPIAVLYRDGIDDKSLAEKLLQTRGVLLTPTSYFYMPSGLRISLGHHNHELLIEAMRSLNELIESREFV